MSGGKEFSYDYKCEELARFFLNGKKEERIRELAQRIQDCIEEALEEWGIE